ncbi:phospholipase D family protein [Rhizobium leguminosarum]|uniref:phospholipase D family protein n=1 Tax=Rhizobium leguminosarum TaxID=384 RepID=UPI001441E5A5|nr:phospholipase D family protein [Rhizobium leguminosarum]NKL87330.1 hypothetical protein [Rhizobium leguminosarum bv. viciae]NKM94186.1 hypothetical protein [Rhizobium leguminosarum bv. viciae]
MLQLIAPRVWHDITAEVKRAKKPCYAAVAYFGRHGHELLPLPENSKLVVNASIEAVRAGVTAPSSLKHMLSRGVHIYSLENLHAKAYAFDNAAFLGSANVSKNSASYLFETVVKFRKKSDIQKISMFVESICLNRLDDDYLTILQKEYRPPKKRKWKLPSLSTLLMELNQEQGKSRMSQVQPPIPVWQNYFGIDIHNIRPLPTLTLKNISTGEKVTRSIIPHDHNYTIEIPGAGTKRPAILMAKKLADSIFEYDVVTIEDSRFDVYNDILSGIDNPLKRGVRRWVIV